MWVRHAVELKDINPFTFQKKNGWSKRPSKGAIAGRLDFHSNENDMDYFGGDVSEPC